ncbi:YdeI/OmpD-associated family protein [Roseiarcaceae bacterium H3SJ34-1]|uniref:YdeI/OmpD-associated family protein n=1 Tax=Terripilifer ovatus TaxID=3032367 RepID=UPI003AB9AA01|nr:YdeI/OmpD-associated family protein [Roseiarcaceae bacterium H3SJ34-1]
MAIVRSGLPVMAFPTIAKWEAWLAAQPASSPGIWLKLARKASGAISISRQEAIEGALCHGWIDGQLDSFDESHWLVRFTPRKKNSKWSQLNRSKAEKLIEQGRLAAAGLREIDEAKADGRWEAAYAPQSKASVPEDLQQALDAKPKARRSFDELDSANRYAILYRLQTAKTEKTRAARLEKFVAMLARGETIHPRKTLRKAVARS